MAGSMHLFKITGMLTPENVKLKRKIMWDVIKLDWMEVNVILNGNRINLPKSITIMFRDKFKIRSIAKENPCSFILFKAMFTMASRSSMTYQIYFQGKISSDTFMYSTKGHDKHRYYSVHAEGYPYLQERLKYASIHMQSMGYGS